MLDRLKDDVATRHIPVQIITTEEERERGLRMGAMGVLTKPVKTKRGARRDASPASSAFIEPHDRRRLLVVEPRRRPAARRSSS